MNAGASLLIAAGLSMFQTDAAIIGTALAAQQGKLHPTAALLGCFLGSAVGDVAWFLCGRYFGAWAMSRWPLVWLIRPQQVAVASRWLSRRGDLLLLGSRFMPAFCTAIQFAAGMLHTRPRRAIPLLLIAAVLNTLTVFGLAVWLGHEIEVYLAAYRKAAVGVVFGAGLLLLLVLHYVPGLIAGRAVGAAELEPVTENTSPTTPDQP